MTSELLLEELLRHARRIKRIENALILCHPVNRDCLPAAFGLTPDTARVLEGDPTRVAPTTLVGVEVRFDERVPVRHVSLEMDTPFVVYELSDWTNWMRGLGLEFCWREVDHGPWVAIIDFTSLDFRLPFGGLRLPADITHAAKQAMKDLIIEHVAKRARRGQSP